MDRQAAEGNNCNLHEGLSRTFKHFAKHLVAAPCLSNSRLDSFFRTRSEVVYNEMLADREFHAQSRVTVTGSFCFCVPIRDRILISGSAD